ncbi:uncharacterized protein H6S33_012713 [Morchella sextelata]|uniref:uncharacterized protein n=1 Tax=Morchella sextelata TaxID=1174677 RepID=UPI001D056514|nr:uncharacterized protein H6S33_012713 [Morchella sextelata]KAH0609227.1 hypothetical protein H6S33_012713 [Morchella sextelata]
MGGNLFPILQEEGQLAHVYSVIGRSGDAEDLYMSSLRRCKLVSLSEHHPLTRRVMDGLAIIYRGQGRWKEAKDIEVRILNTLRNVLGDIHSEPLRAMANLTTTYWTVGRVTEADALGEQLLLSLKKERSDVDILNDLENLCIYPDVARWRTQSKVLTQVLSIHKTEFGDNHANTFAALSNLSSTYRCQGRWKDSAEFEEQIVSGFTNEIKNRWTRGCYHEMAYHTNQDYGPLVLGYADPPIGGLLLDLCWSENYIFCARNHEMDLIAE